MTGGSRLAVALLLGLAPFAGASAEDTPEEVHVYAVPPLHFYLGLGLQAVTSSGAGLSAEAGVQVLRVLAGGSIMLAGNAAGLMTYTSARCAYVLSDDELAAPYVGLGMGAVTFGDFFDQPRSTVFGSSPEVGVILGQGNLIGRMVASARLIIPWSRPGVGQYRMPWGFVAFGLLFSL